MFMNNFVNIYIYNDNKVNVKKNVGDKKLIVHKDNVYKFDRAIYLIGRDSGNEVSWHYRNDVLPYLGDVFKMWVSTVYALY